MTKRKFVGTGARGAAGASMCALFVACSNSSPPAASAGPDSGSPESGSTAPPGTSPGTLPFAACSPLEPGCYTYAGTYATPATAACATAGAPTTGAADTHCAGQPPQSVSGASCSLTDAGPAPTDDGGSAGDDAGPAPVAGPCGENGPDYGSTMYGTEADDDDCKYHVSYTASPICENNGTYFIVKASYLTQDSAPLTNACAYAEVCLSNTHPGPAADGRPPGGKQVVVEGPPGTYTIGPVEFDAAGDWTVRFHFNESCCDLADDSPHGHAAFHVTVP